MLELFFHTWPEFSSIAVRFVEALEELFAATDAAAANKMLEKGRERLRFL